ncbi:vWA domain-containing protein [Saccharothrix yanglingensis]|uniref:VWA domain-containing protein n=1 Tax=Saccharothrix yanglingensis TaxID=659496 RepID=A0ABU0WU97_9PSEU|nr:vWA domain-containing protein [Saccharothrix yanglingensis]MDQ2583411.1 VWA domain-containing protein [Saccharothrix yanglingensis]
MRPSRRRGALLAVAALAVSAVQLTSPAVADPAAAAVSKCGPLDVAFVLDDTGSMGGAIANLKTGINSIVNDVVTASGGDYQFGLVTFKDNVTIHNDLAPGNAAAVTNYVTNTLAAGGGGGEPEASDEALNTVVNNRAAAGRPQNVDFNGTWRSNAMKFVVLVTDARPGGFDDAHGAVDVANAAQWANDALGKGIKISPVHVPTSPAFTPVITPIMQNYATTTGGVFTQTTATGAGTADAIRKLLSDCRQTDVFMRDQVSDTGVEANPNGTVWNSPDIKVCPGLADCGAGTQPVVGATNYVHVRLNNPGPYGAGTASGVLKVYRTPAGGGTTWNNATNGDWVFIGQQALTVPAGVTVAKIPWADIPGPGHFCLLARWVSATDPMTFAEGPNTALNTKNNNNIAWKNFQTIRGRVLEPVRSWFTLGNATGRDAKTDLVLTAEKPVRGTLVVDLGRELLERWRVGGGQSAGVKQVGETAFQFDPQRAGLFGIPLKPGERHTAELTFTPEAPGEYLTSLVQFVEGEDHGGVAYQVLTDRE